MRASATFQGGIIYLKLIGVKKLEKLVDKLFKKLGGSGSPVRSPTKLDSFDILKRARDTDRLVDLRTRAAGPGSRLVRRSWSNSHESLSMVKDLLAEMAEEERGKFEKRCKLLFERLRRRRCLIILDNCDDLLENAKFDVRDFVGSLLDTTKGCRVLLTARTNLGGLPGFGETLHQLAPLKRLDSAKLFVRLSPHYHTASHLLPAGSGQKILRALAASDVVAKLGGIPGVICKRAYSISEEEWFDIIESAKRTAGFAQDPLELMNK